MFGNCATGSVAMVTAPTITIRIEMTIATMGRLMKNLDISVSLHERLGADSHARTSALDAFGNYALTRRQSFADHPHRSDLAPGLDLLNAYRIVVVQHGDLIRA